MRMPICLVLVLGLSAAPAAAQQPIRDAAAKAAAEQSAGNQPASKSRARTFTGAAIAIAGGGAIILGGTALRTERSTSGNTPPGAYNACVALKANPVYRNNDCDGLKGPNKALMIGGLAAAVTGVTLMIAGSSMNSVEFGPAAIVLRHRVKF
jgi:hypothetical protein